MGGFQEAVFAVVSRIPAGKVMTYRAVAEILGKPGAARAIGQALKQNTHPFQLSGRVRGAVPCHRVVRSDGTLGGYNGGVAAKRRLLEREGVPVVRGRVEPGARVDVRPPRATLQHMQKLTSLSV